MERTRGIADAVSAVRRGELVVLPTDTVYGVGADAFTPAAVQALLDAKGRGRDMPPPVLVGSVRAATALVEDLGTYGQDLIDEFWPGALTLVCRANPNLMWDLGETKGTVAVRMPMHELAVEVLKETGPLAVSSANLSGEPAARNADEAEKMLGDSISVYLDGGRSGHADPSTIIDLTGSVPRLLRLGAIPEDKIRAVVGVLLTDEDEPAAPPEPAELTASASGAGETKPSLTKHTAAEAAHAPAEPASAPAEPASAPAEPADAPSGSADAPSVPGGSADAPQAPPESADAPSVPPEAANAPDVPPEAADAPGTPQEEAGLVAGAAETTDPDKSKPEQAAPNVPEEAADAPKAAEAGPAAPAKPNDDQ
ncbi:L-threonylcarbamoyladenylate synthase [Actinomadura napierensis]|uniref:L-threonylcarbamoyladenylate synthase n=2 Tax=Actinomadura napierensis TaxID=267854 RepID=A0ABP5M7C4_9ACTN